MSRQLEWRLEVDSVGDLHKMIVSPLPCLTKCSTYQKTLYTCQPLLNEISQQQLAKMLMILRVNRDWFSLIQSRDRKNDYYDLYSDILQICILKVNQHQLVHVRMDRLLKAVSSFLRRGNRLSRLKEKLIYINFGAIWNALCQDLDLIFIGNQKSHSKNQMNRLKGTWIQFNGWSILAGVFRKRQLYRQQTGSLEKTQQIMKMSLQECLTSQQIETLDSIYSLIEERRKRIQANLGEKLPRLEQNHLRRKLLRPNQTVASTYPEQMQQQMRQILLKVELSPAFDDPLTIFKQYTQKDPYSHDTVTISLKQVLKQSRLLAFKKQLRDKELDQIQDYLDVLTDIFEIEEDALRIKALGKMEDTTLIKNEQPENQVKEEEKENAETESPSETQNVLHEPRIYVSFTAIFNSLKKKRDAKVKEEPQGQGQSQSTKEEDAQRVVQQYQRLCKKEQDETLLLVDCDEQSSEEADTPEQMAGQRAKLEAKNEECDAQSREEKKEEDEPVFRVTSVVNAAEGCLDSLLIEAKREKEEETEAARAERRTSKKYLKHLDTSAFEMAGDRGQETTSCLESPRLGHDE